MIHLSQDETSGERAARAIEEMKILEEEGFDGVIIENYHGSVQDIRDVFEQYPDFFKDTNLSIGINVLPNDYEDAFKLAHEFNCDFIQLDYISGSYKNKEEIDEVNFKATKFLYPDIKVLGGVWPKYYKPSFEWSLVSDMREGVDRSDAVVVTGEGTGKETPIEKIKTFRVMCGKHPLIVGAGVNPKNVVEQLTIADGVIVGSCLKPAGQTTKRISRELVKEFMVAANKVTLQREYEFYMKSVTDRFMRILSDENTLMPNYKKLSNGQYEFGNLSIIDSVKEFFHPVIGKSDAQSFETRTEVEQAWAKERNRIAVEFLKKNTITFEQWFDDIYNASQKS